MNVEHPKTIKPESIASEILKKNGVLAAKISKALNIVEPALITLALQEVVKFLYLVAYFEQKLTPSEPVDKVWHEFILFTREYARFCENHFDRFIHHSPGGDESVNCSQYRQTIALYHVNFGVPSELFWNVSNEKVSMCGSCQSIQAQIRE